MAAILRVRDKDGNVVNIPAIQGAPGKPGEPGKPGDPGYTPQKNVDYFDGNNGVGIADIQLKSSDETGNTYTIILDNGETYDFVAPAGPVGEGGGGVVMGFVFGLGLHPDDLESMLPGETETFNGGFVLYFVRDGEVVTDHVSVFRDCFLAKIHTPFSYSVNIYRKGEISLTISDYTRDSEDRIETLTLHGFSEEYGVEVRFVITYDYTKTEDDGSPKRSCVATATKKSEVWTFTLTDGSTVEKEVVVR